MLRLLRGGDDQASSLSGVFFYLLSVIFAFSVLVVINQLLFPGRKRAVYTML